MANYTVTNQHQQISFDASIPPVLEIESGDVVTFETGDSTYQRLSEGESVEAIGLDNFNTVTGPVFVRGAQPGDVLRIHVRDVQVSRAWSFWLPDFGGLSKQAHGRQLRQIPLRDNRAYISDTLSVPLKPMIGCIGLAPKEGKASTLMPAYPFGGNMDLVEMAPGATLELPVQVAGGLLSVGDLHAAMGVSEATSFAVEAAGTATLEIDVEKNRKLNSPRLYTGGETLCLGMADTLEKAHQIALDEAYNLLTNEWHLDPFDAYAYASACVEIRFGGPAMGIVIAAVPDRTA